MNLSRIRVKGTACLQFAFWHWLERYSKRGSENKRGVKIMRTRTDDLHNTKDGFAYTENSGRATIVKYEGQAKDLVIPERIRNLLVSTIGNEAFAASS